MIVRVPWETIRILVTVKAYPNPSAKYRETSCVAGVSKNGWIRLYPVRYRYLPFSKAFHKWEVIQVKVRKHLSDPRPESYTPDEASIKRLEKIDTGKDRLWQRRKELVLPTASRSMCHIISEQRRSGKSLGMFRPREVLDFKMVQEEDEWSQAEANYYRQLGLFEPALKPVERLPYSFKYTYRCKHPECNGHIMKIVDWEIYQLYRKLRDKYRSDAPLIQEKMRQKWLYQFFAPDRASYFFTGNMRQYPRSFILLGVFWPPA